MPKGSYTGLNSTVTRKSLRKKKPLSDKTFLARATTDAAKYGKNPITPEQQALLDRSRARRQRLKNPTVDETNHPE